MKLIHTSPAQPQGSRRGGSHLIWAVTIAAAIAAAYALAPMSWGPNLQARAGTDAHPPGATAASPPLALGAASASIQGGDLDLGQPIEAYDASGRSVAAYDH